MSLNVIVNMSYLLETELAYGTIIIITGFWLCTDLETITVKLDEVLSGRDV